MADWDDERKKAFGEKLREARELRGWSQTQLAERVSEALGGVPPTTQRSVSQWELGEHVPRRVKIGVLEHLLRLQRGAFAAILEDGPEPETEESDDDADVHQAISALRDEIQDLRRTILDFVERGQPEDRSADRQGARHR